MEMKILGRAISFTEDYVAISSLKFLKDNPRVYTVTHGESGFEELLDEEQQDHILGKLRQEPSVRNLIADVKRHGGLIEPILVRRDSMEVIEGNSRLAVYRILHTEQADGDWEWIPCHVVSGLDDREQAAFLNQIHVKGKAQWSPYEKANFAYVRRSSGWTIEVIAELFGESAATIRTRINVIELMIQSDDNQRSHFSHYDVLVRTPSIWKGVKERGPVRERIVEEIKALDSDSEQDFTAQDLRRKLPVIIRKPKVLQRYVAGTIDLEEGYQRARVSRAEDRVKRALSGLEEISKEDVDGLDKNSLNSLKQATKKLVRAVERIRGMVEVGGVA